MVSGRTVLALLLAALLSGCGDGSGPTTSRSSYSLAFAVQPSDVSAGATVLPVVQVAVRDAAGAVVATATDEVTLALSPPILVDPQPTLFGTRTVRAVNGVAKFADLSVRTAISGYTLNAAAPGRATVTSAAFTVSPGAPASLTKSVDAPPSAFAGQELGVAVHVQDSFDNNIGGTLVTFTVSAGGGTTESASINTNGRGVASAIWYLGSAPGTNTLSASVSELSHSPATFSVTGLTAPPPADVAGTWSVMLGPLSDGTISSRCAASASPITLVLAQSGPTFTGTYVGGDLTCLIRFDPITIHLGNGAIANGAIEGSNVRLDLGMTGIHLSGTISGDSASGTARYRSIAGPWQASKH